MNINISEEEAVRRNRLAVFKFALSMEDEKMIQVQTFNYLPEEARKIRTDVFMLEQGFQNEFDEIINILHRIKYVGKNKDNAYI